MAALEPVATGFEEPVRRPLVEQTRFVLVLLVRHQAHDRAKVPEPAVEALREPTRQALVAHGLIMSDRAGETPTMQQHRRSASIRPRPEGRSFPRLVRETHVVVPDDADQDRSAAEPIVLGLDRARAAAAEEAHRSAHADRPSPLLGLSYSKSAGEFDLTRFVNSDSDERLRSLLDSWHQSSTTDFTGIRDAMTMDDFYTLITFAQRATLRSLRENTTHWARSGTTGIAAIASSRVDWRDVSRAAALLAYALNATGAEPQPSSPTPLRSPTPRPATSSCVTPATYP